MINEQMQTLQQFLEKSEKSSIEENKIKQWQHFEKLVNYARQSVPFYKSFYRNLPIQALPILTRENIQKADNVFISTALPSFHGKCYPIETSGSTGKPVKIATTDFTRLFYDALMLRDHRWHKRDFYKKLMSIRWERREFAQAPKGHYQDSWGPPINQYKITGPSIFINVSSPTPLQIEAILFYKPEYINSYPSQLVALAEYCIDNAIQLPFLEEIRTTGETFSDSYKNIIKQAWPHVKITDVYSCVEMGFVAQQCPEFGNYHVNSENVYCEIVDENDQPCLEGKTGRVLLTSLLNYATPMIRYEVGDYAAWGKCDCGRTLPVIHKIHGRKRNRLKLPTGESLFPYLGERKDRAKIVNTVRKFQFVQHNVNDIEYKIVTTKPITLSQEAALKKFCQKNLGYPFNILITYHEDIPTGPSGKYEEFVSLV